MPEKTDARATTHADPAGAGTADKLRTRARNSLRGTGDLIREIGRAHV